MRTLRTLLVVLTLALTGVLSGGPAAADPVPQHDLDEAFPLGGGQEVAIRGETLRMRFVSVVEDSRCPATVLCYWPGRARIAVDAWLGDGPATPIVLETYPGPNPGGHPATVGPYTIQLQGLDPSPLSQGESIPTDEYAARVVVWRTG